MSKTYRETFILSGSIPKSNDGNYMWHENAWLIIHETIRRDILRGERATSNMNVLKHPWHIVNFHTWITEYFFPAIHIHHEGEDLAVGSHYKSLGVDIEFGNDHNHTELVEMMNNIEAQSKSLYDATKVQADSNTLLKLQGQLQNLMTSFKEYMFCHLDEEDKFWPSVFEKYGLEEHEKCMKKVFAHDSSKTGNDAIAFKALIGAVFDAGGFHNEEYPKTIACGLQIEPWCSEIYINNFYASVPLIPRILIFRGEIKGYKRKWKLMIDSVCGDDDILQLSKKSNNKLFSFFFG